MSEGSNGGSGVAPSQGKRSPASSAPNRRPRERAGGAATGLTTANVQRIARESGLYFPPDPGAAEQSQIGGNIATNAGGPHAFKRCT